MRDPCITRCATAYYYKYMTHGFPNTPIDGSSHLWVKVTVWYKHRDRGDYPGPSLKLGSDLVLFIPERDSLREMEGPDALSFEDWNVFYCWFSKSFRILFLLPWSSVSLLLGLFFLNSVMLWWSSRHLTEEDFHPLWTHEAGMWLGVSW